MYDIILQRVFHPHYSKINLALSVISSTAGDIIRFYLPMIIMLITVKYLPFPLILSKSNCVELSEAYLHSVYRGKRTPDQSSH